MQMTSGKGRTNICSSAVKSMVFAIGWKGEVRADLEQAQTHKHQHQI